MAKRGMRRRSLAADHRGLACVAAQSVVNVYVDELRAGVDAPSRSPRTADHFVSCRSCGQILQGLVAAVEAHDVLPRDPWHAT